MSEQLDLFDLLEEGINEKEKEEQPKGAAELVCILDRSGSMMPMVEDAIAGFNQFLRDQKALPGKANLTVVLFDDQYEVLHNSVSIKKVPELDGTVFTPRGWTALYDAVGITITNLQKKISKKAKKNKPSRVIIMIMTDGAENKSKEFNQQQVKEMVESLEKNEGWSFLYLAQGLDTVQQAVNMGIQQNSYAYLGANVTSASLSYKAATQSISDIRITGAMKGSLSDYSVKKAED